MTKDEAIPVDRRPLLLYVTDTEGLGGAESYLRTLLLHADQRHYRVGLALPPRPATQPLIDRARAGGVQVASLEGVHRDGLSAGALVRAAALLRRLRPALIHFVLASPRRCAETVIAAWLARVPRRLATFQLVTPVPRFGRTVGALRALNRRLQYRTLHHGIAVSAGNRRLLIEQYGFPAARLALIPNAVDIERFRPRERDTTLRAAWGVPPGTPLLGVVGRLSRQKGHQVLFEALPQVWAAHPDVHVALIGAGELESDLRTQAMQVDWYERIHFVGQQERMPEALAELDLFVLPSLYEGLSFAVLEAMAMERAIVATAVDGTAEVIEPEHNGILVPPGVPGPLAAAIVRLLGDPPLRAQLGLAARAAVLAHFDQRHMLERTFALYA
jgi:glycosyltransferase involved in cell wall biosynthesis